MVHLLTNPLEVIPIEAVDAAVLSVKSAARLLGVHPNTVRAWTDQGRLRCLRINERGDRRYRAADLNGFLRSAGGSNGIAPSDGPSAKAGRQPSVRGAGDGQGRITPTGPGSSPVDTGRVLARHDDDVEADASRLSLLAGLTRLAVSTPDRDEAVRLIARSLRHGGRFDTVAIAERSSAGYAVRIVESSSRRRASGFRLDARLAEVCLRDGRPLAAPRARPGGSRGGRWRAPSAGSAMDIYVPILSAERAWGLLVVESPASRPLDSQDLDLLHAVGDQLALIMGWSRMRGRLRDRHAQAQALARMTTESSTHLDLPDVMSGMVDHAIELFGADRGAVYMLKRDDSLEGRFSRNVSARYLAAVAQLPRPCLDEIALETRRAVWAADAANDPRAAGVREAILSEGFDSVATVPLQAEGSVVGLFSVYHDAHHEWNADDLQILEALGAQGGVAVRNAANYEQMATWAAQLQSIQQLGTRLGQLTTVKEIGVAIASELDQLIDYHNVRVYRVEGGECVPVAWRGHIGEYTDEDADQLRLKVGEGITGWVAEHGEAQYLPDAASDPRSQTIPGTDDDLPESMLLAPMRHEDRIIGVIVLSKLGIDQFGGGGAMRLLDIYASLAAQAMTNADATERLQAQSSRLARQVESQRELMRMTESILSTLDPRLVMESIADRLGHLVKVDDLGIHTYDGNSGILSPIFARGVHSELFMSRSVPDEHGVGGWVARHGEARLVARRGDDPSVAHQEGDAAISPSSIIAPLRSRDRVIGILSVERHGNVAQFDEEEFELLKLFSGHVSIALQNALAHQAVEIRAQTDSLTGLMNHGAFTDHLAVAVARGVPFSLLLVDLDDYKRFNDRRGHDAGSQLLTGIAQALRESCREADEIFRYGGDEFTLILPGADAAGAMVVARKITDAVRVTPAPGQRRRSGVTCSVGVASFPTDAMDVRELVRMADQACYLAKRLNGDRVVATGQARTGEEMEDWLEETVSTPQTAVTEAAVA